MHTTIDLYPSELFTRALSLVQGRDPTPKFAERIEHQVGIDAARWAFTQWDLRKRAKAKFTLADTMLFDRDGLEMASHEAVAKYHASQFAVGELVADLTCGIGSDLIELARRGPVIGFEIDPTRHAYALHNLDSHSVQAKIRNEDCLNIDWMQNPDCGADVHVCTAAFADPARRSGGTRFVTPEDFSPNPTRLAEKMRDLRLCGIKLSPMLPDDFLESFGGKLEFVSFGRECREAVVWVGKEAGGGRYAVHIESGERITSEPPPRSVQEPNEFLYDCDPASVRAHALGALCGKHDLVPLGDSNGYLTSNHLVVSPWLRGYRVVTHGRGDAKATQSQLTRLSASISEVKTRGVKEQADVIRNRFKSKGDRSLTLVVWPVGKSQKHSLVEPI